MNGVTELDCEKMSVKSDTAICGVQSYLINVFDL